MGAGAAKVTTENEKYMFSVCDDDHHYNNLMEMAGTLACRYATKGVLALSSSSTKEV